MTKVVRSNAVVNPRAVAWRLSVLGPMRSRKKNVLVVLCDTAAATAAVLAAKGLSRHARNTKVFFVKFPQFKELLDHLSLLVSAANLRNVSRVSDPGHNIEKGGQGVEDREKNVQNGRRRICS